MTLAVRFHGMEHFKSTIVTTAVLVTGLITAAHVLHPRDPAFEARRGTTVVASADAGTTWSDPPARLSQVAAPGAEAAVPRPAAFTLLPLAMTASLGIDDRVQAQPIRKVEHAHARRMAQAGSRSRSAAITARADLEAAHPAEAAMQPGKTGQRDPIGDLMRAIGLVHDSEG